MVRAERESLGLCRVVAWDHLQVVAMLLCHTDTQRVMQGYLYMQTVLSVCTGAVLALAKCMQSTVMGVRQSMLLSNHQVLGGNAAMQ